MESALQAHSIQLQNYLLEWSEQQQQLLEQISTSPTAPRVEAGIGQQAVVDSMTTKDASNIMSTDDAALLFGPSDKQAIKEIHGDPSQTNDGGFGPVERCRHELVDQFQFSLTQLKNLMHPRKEDLEGWVAQTLAALEDEVSKLDVLGLSEEVDADHSPSTRHPDNVLSERHRLLRRQTPYQKILAQFDCVIRSRKFELVVASVILCNAVVMGISADYNIKHVGRSQNSILESMELAFLSFYALELLLRIVDEGRRFFTGEDFKWNLFDTGLVVLAVIDQFDFVFSGVNVSFLRLLKLLKMAKLLRMIRLMKAFKQLRLLLASVIGSFNAMIWAFLLVLIICYTASILFLNLITNFLLDARAQSTDISVDLEVGIETYWNSLATSMNSLIGAATGGDDWFGIAQPLRDIGWVCYLLFLFYMGFFVIVILNAFTSLFVQAVVEHEARDAQAIISTEMENKDKYITQLQGIFDRMDEDGDGFISMTEFFKHAHDPELYTWACYLDIDLSDAQQFFQILSNHGTQALDIDSFVMGCIKLKGSGRQIDLMAIYEMIKHTHKFVSECYVALELQKHQIEKLQQQNKQIVAMIYAGNSPSTLNHRCRAQRKAHHLSL